VNALAITRDKRFLAAAGNPKIHLMDASGNRNEPIHAYEGHHNNVTAVGFQRDSRWLYSSSEDGTIKIWDIRTVKCQRTFECSKKGTLLNSVILHPNQVDLYSCDHYGVVRCWNLSSNTCSMVANVDDMISDGQVGTYSALQSSSLRSLSMSLDGTRLFAGAHSGHVHVWSLSTQQQKQDSRLVHLYSWKAHDAFITKCLASADGSKLATASADHKIRIWDVDQLPPSNAGEEKPQVAAPLVRRNSINEPSRSNPPPPSSILLGHQKWVWDCVFSADSAYLVSASSDHTARLWNLQSGEVIRQYVGHEKAVVSVAMNDLPL
jgi:G protein beta subunit-like protein